MIGVQNHWHAILLCYCAHVIGTTDGTSNGSMEIRVVQTFPWRIEEEIVATTGTEGIFRDPQSWDPFMVSFPYYSHIFRDSYVSGMGISKKTIESMRHVYIYIHDIPGSQNDLYFETFNPSKQGRNSNQNSRVIWVPGMYINWGTRLCLKKILLKQYFANNKRFPSDSDPRPGGPRADRCNGLMGPLYELYGLIKG